MNNKKIKIYGIRWLIQAAEKAGWTIGGYKLAYEISGDIGLLALNITMLIAATATSGLLNASNINFNWNIISNSVKLRVISFLFFICAWQFEEIIFILCGGVFSGFYVGSFWPTFYQLQRQSDMNFKVWNCFEKASGIILIMAAAFFVEWLGSGLLLIMSLSFLLFALIIISREEDIVHEEKENRVKNHLTFVDTFQYPAILAFLEGFLNNSISISRLVIILTGTITISDQPEIISLGGIIAISTLIGASVPGLLERIIEDRFLVNIGLIITLISAMMLLFESTWFFGIIMITGGTAVLFPILKKEVEWGFEKLNLEGCPREYSRNQGRLFSNPILAVAWIVYGTIFSTFIVIGSATILLVFVWMNRPVWVEEEVEHNKN